jgi:UDP-N-acetylmuramoyl-tripeptide--D-alanyl-D-alanine ligase
MLSFELTLDDVRRATSGHWRVPPANPGESCPPINTDSRSFRLGDLFLALRGQRFDGHDYLAEALAAGAAGLVVERGAQLPPRHPREVVVLEVQDTLKALGDIAAAARAKAGKIEVAAVVGSSGKTTTKEMLARILRAHAGERRVYASPGNFNNLVGAPKAILEISEEHDFAVLEAGMNAPGELSRLAQMIAPSLSVVTNVGSAHVGRFGSREAHLRAKLEWLESLPAGRRVLLNADGGANLAALVKAANHLEVAFYGIDHDDSIAWPRRIEPMRPIGYRFTLVLPDGEHPVELPLFGAYNVSNALGAAAAAWLMGVDGETIAGALGEMNAFRLRGEVREIAGRRFIVDCYNASPEATRQSLYSAADVECEGRRLAALGSMMELGEFTAPAHRAVGTAVAGAEFDHLFTLGEDALRIQESAGRHGVAGTHCRDHNDLARFLAFLSRPGDLILLKGSRSMEMEKILPRFERMLAPAAAATPQPPTAEESMSARSSAESLAQ